MGHLAVLALMPGTGIVDRHIRRQGKPGREQRVLFRVEACLAVLQEGVDLAG
jgi:hypothetical protein